MELGSKKKVNYKDFEVSKFSPHFFSTSYGGLGCGICCLSLLSGQHPSTIYNTNKKNPNDFKDSFMVNFLRKKKFDILPIKMLQVSNHLQTFTDQITKRHVLMISQIFNKEESSWSVCWGGEYLCHNFYISHLERLEFLNRPILSAFLIKCSAWM